MWAIGLVVAGVAGLQMLVSYGEDCAKEREYQRAKADRLAEAIRQRLWKKEDAKVQHAEDYTARHGRAPQGIPDSDDECWGG